MTLTKRQEKTLEKHSVHHTKKHMSLMRKLMGGKQKKSFTEAHKIAMKDVGKWRLHSAHLRTGANKTGAPSLAKNRQWRAKGICLRKQSRRCHQQNMQPPQLPKGVTKRRASSSRNSPNRSWPRREVIAPNLIRITALRVPYECRTWDDYGCFLIQFSTIK